MKITFKTLQQTQFQLDVDPNETTVDSVLGLIINKFINICLNIFLDSSVKAKN